MRYLILLSAFLISISCETDQKVSSTEMQAYEKELQEKIKAAKIEIGKIRYELENLNDSLQTDLTDKLNKFDQELDDAEKSFLNFKNAQERKIWTEKKAKLDSAIGYLKLKIDTTRTNIKEMLNEI